MARGNRDWLGSILGFLVFLAGVALLLVTFDLAYEMFHIPPERALGISPGKTIQLNEVGTSAAGVVIRIVLLLVMGFVGSLIANRGILLYGHCRPRHVREKHDE